MVCLSVTFALAGTACLNGSLLTWITTSLPSAPGRGSARNPNCLACKNLRRSEGGLVDARPCAEIVSGEDHFQKGAWQQFRLAGSISALAASRILSKAVCSARREP